MIATGVSDGALIACAHRGDRQAFELLYERYKSQVYRTALAILQDRDAAEDILQETFIRLHRSLGSLDVQQPVVPWLHRVTVNLCYNWVRRHRRWLQPLEDMLEWLNSPAQPSPMQIVERHEVQRAVERAVNSLNLDQRVTLVLYYLNGLCVEEIAFVLDCPAGTVKSRLHYGRKNLRRKLLSEGQILQEMVYEFSS